MFYIYNSSISHVVSEQQLIHHWFTFIRSMSTMCFNCKATPINDADYRSYANQNCRICFTNHMGFQSNSLYSTGLLLLGRYLQWASIVKPHVPINDADYRYYINQNCRICFTNHIGFILSHITSLVINSLRGGHAYMHTHIDITAKSNFKKPGECWLHIYCLHCYFVFSNLL